MYLYHNGTCGVWPVSRNPGYGFTLLASYTYGKSLDGLSLEGDSVTGQNSLNLSAETGA
jgi:hypothetical protein